MTRRMSRNFAEDDAARADDVDGLRLAGGAPGQVAQPAVPLSARHLGANPATYRYFLRGRKHSRQPDDELAQSDSLRRLSAFDGALKGFRYHEALDAACANGAPEVRALLKPHTTANQLTVEPVAPQVILRVVEELVQRNGLRIALQGRDQHTLQPIIAFLVRCARRAAPTLPSPHLLRAPHTLQPRLPCASARTKRTAVRGAETSRARPSRLC